MYKMSSYISHNYTKEAQFCSSKKSRHLQRKFNLRSKICSFIPLFAHQVRIDPNNSKRSAPQASEGNGYHVIYASRKIPVQPNQVEQSIPKHQSLNHVTKKKDNPLVTLHRHGQLVKSKDSVRFSHLSKLVVLTFILNTG